MPLWYKQLVLAQGYRTWLLPVATAEKEAGKQVNL